MEASPKTSQEAWVFSQYLLNLGKIHPPIVRTDTDGEITFYWNRGNVILDLGIAGDGMYSYYAKFADGSSLTEDGANLNDPLPERIVKEIILNMN